VNSSDPLWDPGPVTRVVGLPTDLRSTLVTRVQDAEPDHVELLVSPTIAPFLAALAVAGMFIGSIFTPWGLVWGAVPSTIALIYWFWPRRKETEEHCKHEIRPADDLAKAAS
jgi:cytochrome c oxidase subunit 1